MKAEDSAAGSYGGGVLPVPYAAGLYGGGGGRAIGTSSRLAWRVCQLAAAG